MRMGALSTIGYERPKNLIHIVLDNEQHESTGGQSTVSHSVDFCGIAAANGYPVVEQVEDAQALAERIRAGRDELTFLHLKIRPGVPEHLPRPKVTPVEVAARLRRELGERPC